MSDYRWHSPDPQTQAEFYADVPMKRFIAWIVDTFLILSVSAVIVVMTALTGLLILPAIMLVVGFVYRVATISRYSATWGMRLTAIEFRTLAGNRFESSMAVTHTFGYSVCLVLPFFQIISIIMMLTSQRGQGLPDTFLGTIAVNRQAAR